MEEVLGMMKLIVFIILLRDYKFLGMQPRIRRRASPVVVPGGVNTCYWIIIFKKNLKFIGQYKVSFFSLH